MSPVTSIVFYSLDRSEPTPSEHRISMPGHIRRDGVARSVVVVAVFLALSCTPEPTSIEPSIRPLHDQAAAHCENVDAQVSGVLAPLTDAVPASNVLALSSATVTLSGITGTLQTIVTGSSPTGRGNPSAQHITLSEHFVAAAGSFTTRIARSARRRETAKALLRVS